MWECEFLTFRTYSHCYKYRTLYNRLMRWTGEKRLPTITLSKIQKRTSTYIYKYIIQKHAINSLSGGSGAACTNLKSYSLAHKFLGICKLFSAIHLLVSKNFLFHFAFKQLCDPKLWQKWSCSALDIWFDHSYHFLNPFPGHLNIINSLFYRVILRSYSMFFGDVKLHRFHTFI